MKKVQTTITVRGGSDIVVMSESDGTETPAELAVRHAQEVKDALESAAPADIGTWTVVPS